MKPIEKELKAEKQKFVTAVTVDKKFVTAETLINKGIEPYGNRSNRSNSKKTQNQFLDFNAVDWLDWYNERAAIYEYENGDTVFYVYPETFKKEICNGFNFKQAKEVLYKKDWLENEQAEPKSFKNEKNVFT